IVNYLSTGQYACTKTKILVLIVYCLQHFLSYFGSGRRSINEEIASITESTIVAIIKTFSTFLLLRYISPPPPKTGDRPPSGACNNIAPTSNIEITICNAERTV